MSNPSTGISGIAVHVPPFRVGLERWCGWTGADWQKICEVVGTGFRLPGPQQSVYTMAANAIMRLIEQHEINPEEVRFLGLGTESSTDNSAGAVIVKGMVNDALQAQGKEPLSRNCEVPEFKHACLGGVYALKNAVRFLNTDGRNAKAIVVCSDVALYELGSTGEPTQGAGAVALLLENNPSLATIDLSESGSASDYRGVDFRKPIQYRNGNGETLACSNTPVFNGRYSTSCYIDEMQRALEDMYARRQIGAHDYLKDVAAVFIHRPFRRMPESGWAMAWLFGLAAGNGAAHDLLRELSELAEVSFDAVLEEANKRPVVSDFGISERIQDEVFPLLSKVQRRVRGSEAWQRAVGNKMMLGTGWMEELGNMYTGALPAWFAGGLEEAASQGIDLAGKEILLIGYGSGDAAEVIPVHMVEGWEDAARKTDMAAAMANPIDLNREQYNSIHEGHGDASPQYSPKDEFIIERVGSENEDAFQDAGIEYYRFINN